MPYKATIFAFLGVFACHMLFVPLYLSAKTLDEFYGVSSWYGPGFHAKITANGEKYDMFGLSAAHRELPFETLLRVTNLENNRQTVIRINDRGPVSKSLIMDLSVGAAMALGMVNDGVANVRMELVGTKKGLLTQDEAFFLNLNDTLVAPSTTQFLQKNVPKQDEEYYREILTSVDIYQKVERNLNKLYVAGIQEAANLLVAVDNTICLGPFESFLETEKYYFRLATIYPKASVWLKSRKQVKKLVPNKIPSKD